MTIFLGMSEKKQTTEHLTETYKSKTDYCDSQKPGGEKKATEDTILQLLYKNVSGRGINILSPVHTLQHVEERETHQLCLCYFLLLRNHKRRCEKREKRNRHAFIPISDMNS